MYSLHSDFPVIKEGQEMYLTDSQAQVYRIKTSNSVILSNGFQRCASDIPMYKNYYFDVKWLGNLNGIKWHIIVGKNL